MLRGTACTPARLFVRLCDTALRVFWCADVESDQIDFIDSCVKGEEEEEERRSRGGGAEGGGGGGGGDVSSLSSQFMAYIERRITREVQALPALCVS